MSTPLPVAGLTPYCTPEILLAAPTGVTFSSIPAGSNVTIAQREAEQSNICARSTGMVDETCRQPLRATIDTLILYGPGVRVGVDRGGCKPTLLIMTRWPVLEVVSVEVSPNTFPQVWTPVPSVDSSVRYPPAGLYGSSAPAAAGEGGQGILLAPGYVDWRRGPGGYAIRVRYVNGWPHAGITAAAGADISALQVDDCTGWALASSLNGATGATGATGTIYDSGSQEVIQVTAATAAQGPGTLTLAAPLTYPHAAGVMVSALPQTVVWAAILFSASQALTRGATSTTTREIPGRSTSAGGARATSLADQAKALLAPFARIV